MGVTSQPGSLSYGMLNDGYSPQVTSGGLNGNGDGVFSEMGGGRGQLGLGGQDSNRAARTDNAINQLEGEYC